MGRSYSLDLRRRVVSRVEGGRSRRGAAADLQVSPSFSVKLVARHRRTGTLGPQRQGRPPGTGKLAPYRDFLMRRVRETPDITAGSSLVQRLQKFCSGTKSRSAWTAKALGGTTYSSSDYGDP